MLTDTVSIPTSVVVDESPSPNASSSEPESERPISQIEARMAKHTNMLAEYRAKYPRKELVWPEPEERRRWLREYNMKTCGKPYRTYSCVFLP